MLPQNIRPRAVSLSSVLNSASDSDVLLLPYLRANTETEIKRHLEVLLVKHAQPLVQKIVGRKWHVTSARTGADYQSQNEQEAEDIRRDALAQLASRLHAIREKTDAVPIGDFRSYVAVTTYHACDKALREKYPLRWCLKNRMRYLLGHQAGFGLWQVSDGRWLCGFDCWRQEDRWGGQSSKVVRLIQNPHEFLQAGLLGQSVEYSSPGDVIAAVFRWVGQPVELDDLVSAAATLWGVRDHPLQTETSGSDAANIAYETAVDPHADVSGAVLDRDYLQRLWLEIRQLPPRQCAALVLNLRDDQGRGVIALLPLLGIASVREISAALEMSSEQLAELWKDLPIEDALIAERMGMTRQQVINLRKVARERLMRRLKHSDA